MNRTIKLLMFSDIFVLTGFGLIDPILAIFIKEDLIGGTILGAGIASTLFIITKCAVQLPFSRYVDNHKDKVKWLIIGTFFISMVPLIYMFAKNISYIYLAQFIHGIGSGLAYPTWLGLWSHYLDKHHESYEWSLYSTLTGLGTATSAAVGAMIAEFFGFVYTFLLVWVMALLGCFILFNLERENLILKKINIHHYHRRGKTIHKKYH